MLVPSDSRDDGQMEIRIQLDRVEPPAGRLRVVAGDRRIPGPAYKDLCFTGWLGLLRALYEATEEPSTRVDLEL